MWEKPKCPLIDKGINKMEYIQTVEYYICIKRYEVLIHATTRMNLENMQGERCHSQKGANYRTPIIWDVLNRQIKRQETD